MTQAVGNTRSLPLSPDLKKAIDAFYNSSMSTWCLGWLVVVFGSYLWYIHSDYPVIESQHSSAAASSIAIVVSCHMVMTLSAF